ncbi:MAG: hypothetical protein HONBIEJF_01606 [Fimbriimonadaceae bacterium]|nr:hypothetical protein [Fimbriimonadaceae bacterium]
MRSLALVFGVWATVVAFAQPVEIRMMGGKSWGIPPKEASDPRSQARRAIFEAFHREHPDVRVVNAGGLEVVGNTIESAFLMSMAGDTAPDVFYVNFRQYYSFIEQGFCLPLDPLIDRDPSVLSRISPIVREVLTSYDGRIYAMPWFQVANGLYYRKDHFLEAGLDPAKPPRTWAELHEYAKKLTESKAGRIGFSLAKAYHWSNLLWQAGGEIVVPGEGGYWKAAIASEAGVQALEFYRRLMTDKWVGADGAEKGPAAQDTLSHNTDVQTGKVSMWFSYTNDVMLNTSDINPALLGVARMPAGPGGHANEINAGMWAINSQIRNPAKLEACWKFIRYFAGDEAARVNTVKFVELGLGSLVNPVLLRRYGFGDLATQVDPAFVKANEELFKSGKPEPYGRNCQQVYVVMDGALDRSLLEPDTPAIDILRDTAKEMDEKLLGYTPKEVQQVRRTWAWTILGIVMAGCVVLVWVTISSGKRSANYVAPIRVTPGQWRFFWACLLPAALSIAVWAYYPLVRGLVIAFQDYKLVKGSTWVGLDNFIAVFTQPIFYRAVLNSFLYVGLTILIGFLIPIFLALALNEIPRGKVLFRTLFYLPAMTSPIVIAFLWRQFYDKTDQGLLNVFFSPVIGFINSILGTSLPLTNDWLGNPQLAMFAVVLPGIWAGAGPGSILYLAALKNIPEERYEAADLDGATWLQKIRWITLPGLRPLMLINLLGVFIGGFKAMENVFVLTGGGPLYATHTLGLEVWTNAFMFLKFGYATAAAWVMGAILIGFTLMQIRYLLRMRFGTTPSEAR